MSEIKERPLVIGLGGVGNSLVSRLAPGPYGKLLLDTDSTFCGKRDDDFVLIGREMVHGEGCGGKMNIGRAVFRKEREKILSRVIKGGPVFMVCGSGGGTGLPFCVEICRELKKEKIPHLSMIISVGARNASTIQRDTISSLLARGPMKPSLLLSLDHGNDPGQGNNFSPESIVRGLEILAGISGSEAVLRLPVEYWNIAAEADPDLVMKIFKVNEIGSLSRSLLSGIDGPPLISAFSISGKVTEEKISRIIDELGLSGSKTGIGITVAPDENEKRPFP
jgi:hypothetical protein